MSMFAPFWAACRLPLGTIFSSLMVVKFLTGMDPEGGRFLDAGPVEDDEEEDDVGVVRMAVQLPCACEIG